MRDLTSWGVWHLTVYHCLEIYVSHSAKQAQHIYSKKENVEKIEELKKSTKSTRKKKIVGRIENRIKPASSMTKNFDKI